MCQLWEFELREDMWVDACFPSSHHRVSLTKCSSVPRDTSGHLDTALWTLLDTWTLDLGRQRSQRFYYRCNSHWHIYTLDTIGGECTLFMAALSNFSVFFDYRQEDFWQKFMRKLLQPQLGLCWVRKKCLWCKQTALGLPLESLFAQLAVGLSMERVANLEMGFLTNSSLVAHTKRQPVKFTM